jgi:hypothetical protein
VPSPDAGAGLAAKGPPALAVVTDPVEVVVVLDGGVLGVEQNHLVPLARPVLSPVDVLRTVLSN